jgi:3-deoxy-7-phosphoheptulonate synthase
MVIVMKTQATEEEVHDVIRTVEEAGLEAVLLRGRLRKVIAVIGDKREVPLDFWQTRPGVDRVVPILAPYKLAGREASPQPTVVPIDGHRLGGRKIGVIAGPCTVEGYEQTLEIARRVGAAGAVALRGGAFKPRTNPYSFQGLEQEGLRILAAVRAETGLSIVTEVMSAQQVGLVAEHADVLQIGTRNMQNFLLLKEAGRAEKPVLLKRGMSATVEEWLLAAEYILKSGNSHVILCERGIRTFEDHTRNTLSLSAVPYLKQNTHLPVLVDPSHGTGVRSLVAPMCKAAVACGADGLLVEVHPHPEEAVVDGAQTLTCDEFDTLMRELAPIAEAVGRSL